MIGLLKKAIDLPIRMKGNLKRTSGNSLSSLGGQNKDTGAASQTLLTEVILLPWRRLYSGAIPVSAAFVFARVHLLRLEGGAMAFIWDIWVSWLLVKQTENCRPLLHFQTHCWCYLPYANETFFTPTLALGLNGYVGISTSADDSRKLCGSCF